jgi:hypothetical protein
LSDDNSTINYLEEIEEDTTEPDQNITDSVFLEGICSKCIDSSFVHTTRNGVLGVAFRIEGQDSVGKPIKRLLICNHNSALRY